MVATYRVTDRDGEFNFLVRSFEELTNYACELAEFSDDGEAWLSLIERNNDYETVVKYLDELDIRVEVL